MHTKYLPIFLIPLLLLASCGQTELIEKKSFSTYTIGS